MLKKRFFSIQGNDTRYVSGNLPGEEHLKESYVNKYKKELIIIYGHIERHIQEYFYIIYMYVFI